MRITQNRIHVVTRAVPVLGLVAATLLAAPSAAWGPSTPEPVPPGPERPAELPPPPPPLPPKAVERPAGFDPTKPLTLAQVIEVALRQNPGTRAAWRDALAAADELGSKRSAYYPSLDLLASGTRARTVALGGRFVALQNVYGPTLNLNYLLIDFGGRKGDLDEARSLLLAADWTHSAAIQDLVLQVQAAYYNYVSAKASLAAADVTVKQVRTALEAAETRHAAGVATIADVLQARTLVSQAELSYAGIEGSIASLRGALATAVGVPANTPFEVGDLPEASGAVEIGADVEALVRSAVEKRPDLAAARLRAAAAESHVRSVRAAMLPSLSFAGVYGRAFFEPSPYAAYGDSWSVSLVLSQTLFSGFKKTFDTRKAQEEAHASADRAESLEQQAILEAWTSFYDVKTATKQIAAARDLLASADASEQVTLARYKEGVGTLLDLLNAETLLAAARAQEIQARTGWFVALARLARDTGTLSLPSDAPAVSPAPAGKDDHARP